LSFDGLSFFPFFSRSTSAPPPPCDRSFDSPTTTTLHVEGERATPDTPDIDTAGGSSVEEDEEEEDEEEEEEEE
jgi:hypothetical protein